MISKKEYALYIIIIAGIVFFTVWGSRNLLEAPYSTISVARAILKDLFFLFLFTGWGAYTRYRCANRALKNIMTVICVLSVLWLLLSIVKNRMFMDEDIGRYLWYLYYISLLYIPVMCLWIAFVIGERETSFKISVKFIWPLAVSTILFALVLTNELHNLVFVFPENIAIWNNNYTYGVVYYIIAAWIYGCSFISLGMMIAKCRRYESKKLLAIPIFIGILLFLYTVAYVLGFMTDGTLSCFEPIAIYQNLIMLALFESLMRCGMIPVCSHYKDFFMNASIKMKIVDDNGTIFYETSKGEIDDAYVVENKLNHGYAIYETDIAELNQLRSELYEKNQKLKEYNEKLSNEQAVRSELAVVSYRNQLYSEIEGLIAEKIDNVYDLINEISEDKGTGEKRESLFKRITLIMIYIKRKCNLLFLSKGDEQGLIFIKDLELSIAESIYHLRRMGIECGCNVTGNTGMLSLSHTMLCLDLYQEIAEICNEMSISEFAVNLVAQKDAFELIIIVSCDGNHEIRISDNLKEVAANNDTFISEHEIDGGRIIKLSINTGGDQR
ncbi:MAG: histidine kinase N-terminal 7TM domain-containing protein [Bacillota bacterium]|nr:histidine kinase N-terminal 7TM domain-containing protein [Bacillota bacterium]